jgi:hypothetical protein
MSDKDGKSVSQLRTLQTSARSTTSNIVLARTLKNDSDFFMRDDDLKILLKLRRNRLRIGSLSQDLLEQEGDFSGNQRDEDEIIENLKAINSILNGVRASLNGL